MRVILFNLLLFTIIFPTVGYGQQDFHTLFDSAGVQGSTCVYDYKNDAWFFTDVQDAERYSLPASTFKILHSLMALETQAVRNEHQVLK